MKKLNKAYYAYYYTDVNVDPKDANNPFKFYGTSKFLLTSLDMYRENNVYLKNIYLISDFNLVV